MQAASTRSPRLGTIAVTAHSPFVEPPTLVWHNARPFLIAHLDRAYAAVLERLALDREEAVLALEPDPHWSPEMTAQAATGARYRQYNVFDSGWPTVPLFLALRSAYRLLRSELKRPPAFSAVQAWFNVQHQGMSIPRHAHQTPFIGYFIAHGDGSHTRFGPYREPKPDDVIIPSTTGLLVLTLGPRHFHDVPAWHDPDRPRVSFAFNIAQCDPEQVPTESSGFSALTVPFDGPDLLSALPA